MKRPIVIMGGGLSGLALGIALRRREVPVVLHEAGVYPRHRVCGEFVSGVSDADLETLGVDGDLADAERLESARWYDNDGVLGGMTVAARGISRWRLDARLAEKFEAAGGELHTQSRVEPGEGVVKAAGRPRRNSSLVGLKAHATELALDADLEMHVGTNGYLGLARIEDGQVNICGLFRGGKIGNGKGEELLITTLKRGGLHALASRLRKVRFDVGSFCSAAGFQPGIFANGDCAIGDASQMIPPFTGNGMSMAFESAVIALRPVLGYSTGRLTWSEATDEVQQLQRERFARRMRVACGLHGFLMTTPGLRFARLCARRRWLPFQKLLPLVR